MEKCFDNKLFILSNNKILKKREFSLKIRLSLLHPIQFQFFYVILPKTRTFLKV